MIIKVYRLNDEKLIIKSDLAGEYPVYIYFSDDKKTLLYSNSIKNLLDDERVIKPLNILDEGISFLLQSGVVPPPKTIYKNIFIVSIGDKAIIETINNKVEINFSHEFPFLNKNRDKEAIINENEILELLSEATIKRMDESKPSYLFHSAGKDSNTIALALAEAGYQNKVTCISHQSKGDKDESEISKQIALKLGFKHQKLYEPTKIDSKNINSINYYFENIPLPCMDNVVLAYPIYATQINFTNTNIIDGMGNDVFIGHIPSNLEYNRQKKFSRFTFLRPIAEKCNLSSRFELATSTKSEWAGVFGLRYDDSKKIFKNSSNNYNYWKNEDFKRKELDYFDFRASLRGVILDQEIFTRKIRNHSIINSANMILPWTNEKVASYFSELPEKYLFDKKEFKNKLILRKILKEKIELDSDKLGKMAYEFDFWAILMMMKNEVDSEILLCKLWDKKEIEIVLNNFYSKINSNHRMKQKIKLLVQRLYLVSAWYNKNRYIKK